jgi:hypothetical protein
MAGDRQLPERTGLFWLRQYAHWLSTLDAVDNMRTLLTSRSVVPNGMVWRYRRRSCLRDCVGADRQQLRFSRSIRSKQPGSHEHGTVAREPSCGFQNWLTQKSFQVKGHVEFANSRYLKPFFCSQRENTRTARLPTHEITCAQDPATTSGNCFCQSER